MNRIYAAIVFALVALTAHAQKASLNLYSAYAFDDSFDTYYSSSSYYNGKIVGGYQWGAGIELHPREDYGVELLYYRQDTKAPVSYYGLSPTTRTLDIGINYIMLGGTRYIKKDKIEPYGGFMLGAAIGSNKNPQGSERSSATKFAVGGRLGTNIWVSDRVGIKLQAQFLMAVQGVGGGLYFGTGGTGAGVSTYSTLTQFVIGGGLAIKMGAE